MVDPTKGIGTAANIPASDKPQPRVKRDDNSDEVQKKRRQDEIAARKRDLSSSEAEQTAQDTRKQLQDSKQNLGGHGFDETV